VNLMILSLVEQSMRLKKLPTTRSGCIWI